MNLISLDVNYFTRRTVFYHTGRQNPTAIVYDPVEDKIYWSDVDRSWVASAFRNGTGLKVLHQCNVHRPEGIDIDQVGRNIYWTDTGTNRIEVGDLDGSTKKALITVDLDEPRDIVVNPEEGYVSYFLPCMGLVMTYVDLKKIITGRVHQAKTV